MPEAARRGGAALLAAALVVLAAAFVGDEAGKLGRWAACAPVLAAVAVAVAVIPTPWVRATQVGALALVWGWTRWRAAAVLDDVAVLVVGPVVLAAAAYVVPWHRRPVRRATLLLATAAFGVLWVADVPEEGIVAELLLLLLVLAGTWDLHGTTPRRATAYVLAASALLLTPLVPRDTWTVRRDARHVLAGGGMVAAAVLLTSAAGPLGRVEPVSPLAAAWRGDLWAVVPAAVGFWAIVYGKLVGHLLLVAGTLRVIGLDVRAPLDMPWAATDFLAFWRRSNVYRYRLFVDVYWRELGLRGPLGVFVVFALSGLHHAALASAPFVVFGRWLVDGAVCALTAWWKARASRAAVAAWIRGEPRRPRPRGVAVGLAVASAVGVLAAHGVLLAIVRAGDRFETWLPGGP